ncbi:MAG: carboxypeptidase-like regulatory domain-containing protein [Thermoplasmata archaeon]
MTAPTITLRCTRCGQLLSAPSPASLAAAWFACPHCGAPVPVVAPRRPAPLFSWEVYPHLYPPLPPPRGPSPRLPQATFAILLALAVGLAGVAGFFVLNGATTFSPPAYTVGGVVTTAGGVPFPGATVNISGENGFDRVLVTGSGGTFELAGVPGGGVLVNVSHAGYESASAQIFLSPVYSAPGGGARALQFELEPGPSSTSLRTVDTAFPDLESLLATLFSGAIWIGLAAGIAGLGARAVRRAEGSPVGVAGGCAGILAPFAFVLLGITAIYPALTYVGGVLIALGVLATTLLVLPMVLTGPSPDP